MTIAALLGITQPQLLIGYFLPLILCIACATYQLVWGSYSFREVGIVWVLSFIPLVNIGAAFVAGLHLLIDAAEDVARLLHNKFR